MASVIRDASGESGDCTGGDGNALDELRNLRVGGGSAPDNGLQVERGRLRGEFGVGDASHSGNKAPVVRVVLAAAGGGLFRWAATWRFRPMS